MSASHGLFVRYPGNPILTADHWPYPANAVSDSNAVFRRSG